MATVTNERFGTQTLEAVRSDVARIAWSVMRALGSLKIAVLMFALGTLMLFIGTLAQDEETIVDVKRHYFNSWIAYVPLDVFAPKTLFPHENPIPGTIAIPGGATIGLVLLINLFAAKLTRFAIHAKGGRFAGGLIITLLGFVLVAIVIIGAHLGDGLQGEPPFSYDTLWLGTKVTAHCLTLLSLGWLLLWTPQNRVLFTTAVVSLLVCAFVSLFLVFTFDAYRIPDPGLRIVWQLTKSLGVGSVLLIGLMLLFGQRGGNVLIHLGVALLMVGQFIFGDAQTEERISLAEGQKTTAAIAIDEVELVVIDRSPNDSNRVVAFSHPMLIESSKNGTPLSAEGLPFEIRIDRWMENSQIKKRNAKPAADSVEASMLGSIQSWELSEKPKVGGTGESTNVASLYFTVFNKADKSSIGSYATSQWLSDDQVSFNPIFETLEVASKTYDVGLMFRRNYKDYSVTLKNIVLEEYTNSMIPKDYSSYITIRDKEGNVLQDGRVWMNSPLRFRGETFYQSQYISKEDSPYGVEQTVLQVVTNAGWLIPYVSCVLVGMGMLAHFAGTFTRFAMRYERTSKVIQRDWRQWAIGCAVCIGLGLFAISIARPKAVDRDEIDYNAIGSIPVHYGGRVKPLSSAAAEFLEVLSNKPNALLLVDGEAAKKEYKPKVKKVSSSEWMFAAIMREPWIFENPLIRVEATSTTDLNLTRVESNRYSYNDIVDGLRSIGPRMTRIIEAQKAPPSRRETLSFEDKALWEILNKVAMLDSLIDAFEPPFTRKLLEGDPQSFQAEMTAASMKVERVRASNNPAILPSLVQENPNDGEVAKPKTRWDAFGPALFDVIRNRERNAKSDTVLKFFDIVQAYSEDKKNGAKINRLVTDFKTAAASAHGSDVMRSNKVDFEHHFESMHIFGNSQVFYVIVGLVTLLSYAVLPQSLRNIAFWICVGAFLLQTYGIVARIYISDRPPVVSLYSASVFIGWAMVLFCIVAEIFYPIGVSLIVAAISGYLSLSVAYGLDVGDSMPVLRAVLDTQFWLATHVISVSLGYSATFFAGFFGIMILIATLITTLGGEKSKSEWVNSARDTVPVLYRICYAVVCFGIFFSFVGTVLGGLWGDDSWGRFWGWDPKENGALMIVLWNALLLHAKWDKMVGALGFAILAVFGNVVTAWSMFGTNQLGIGLHAYGAFEGSLLMYLVTFVAVQFAFIGLGLLLVLFKPNKVLQ